MVRKLLKTSYRTDNPKLTPLCDGLNQVGTWGNTFDSLPPLVTQSVPGGVKLRWQPWESPFVHPWRVTLQAGLAKVDVAGGRVNRGDVLATVTGLTGLTAAAGLKVWLTVTHYHNHATASTYALNHGTGAFPTSSNTSSSSVTILPVAEIDGTDLNQYLYEDQYVPRLNPPLPGTVNVYYLTAVAGVVQWIQPGACA